MKKLNILLGLLVLTSSAFAQTWSLDKAHSSLRFSISHLTISEVDGAFTNFDGKFTAAKEDFSDAVIELTADVNSINTNNADRDKHLKSPDYFDAAKYPTITFKSKSLTQTSGKNYKLTGDLTLHGVTKPVTLDAVFGGTVVHPQTKKTVAGFKVTGTIKRSDFALAPSTPSAVVGNEVMLDTKIEITKD